MQVIINGKTYEVVNGDYHLVATYDLARQIGGLDPGEHSNELIRKGFVSEAGCRIKSPTVIPDYYIDNTQCVLYEDLELDPDIILDGDKTESDYDNLYYTTTDNKILTPYPYYEEGVTWNYTTSTTAYTFNDGISIDPWYESNVYEKHTDENGKVWYEGYIVKNTREIPSITQSGVFQNCKKLKEITTFINPIIGENCFKNCVNLNTVTILGDTNVSQNVIIGNNAFMNCTQLKTVVLGSYWHNPMDNKVTIGENAFYGDIKLKHLHGQDTITEIGNYAFKNCSGLTVLTLLNCYSIGNQSFENCTNITKIIIQGSAIYGSNIFSGCTNIEEIIFLGNCTTGLTNMMIQVDGVAKNTLKVRVPNDYYNNYYNNLSGITTSKEWKTQLFNNKYQSDYDIVLCDYDTKGYDGVWDTAVAFGWLKYNIRHLTIYESEIITDFPQIANSSVVNDVFDKESGDGYDGYSGEHQGEHLLSFNQFKWFTGLTSVPYAAFSGCTRLTSVTISNSVTSIGDYAFYNCCSLTGELVIPDSVTSIGNNAFHGCSSLTFVTIPNSVTSIEESAFYGCSGLTSVTIPDNVTNFENWVFYDCDSLTSVTIGSGLTNWGIGAFRDCSSLTIISIASGVTSIGEEAFYDCDSLTSIEIPNYIETIETGAFDECDNITTITIGSGITNINDYAFNDAGNNANKCTVTINATIPPTLGDGVFDSDYIKKIYVPVGYGDVYKNAQGWSSYADLIEEQQ